MKDKYDWLDNPPSDLAGKAALLNRYKHFLRSPGKKGIFLRSLLKDTKRQVEEVVDTAKQQDPFAFLKPSYEQSLILNCWIYGIQFICIYTANRIGKTAAEIINFLLWAFPNNPAWIRKGVLKPYYVGDPKDDPENKDNPNKGKFVQVLPRPDISAVKLIWKTIQKLKLKPDPYKSHTESPNKEILQQLQKEIPEAFKPAYPYAPWNKGGTVWMGAPDHKHHEKKIMPIWKKFLPLSSIERFVVTEGEITIKIQGPKRTTVWEVLGLSFEQKETKWSSGATDVILLTEGVPKEIFKEAKLRFTDPGLGGHDFTPYDPANTNHASALAQNIDKGKEGMPLPHFVFKGFSVYNAPAHILPPDKKEGLIKAFKDDPQARARLDGMFYTSSALLLSNLDEEVHFLDWTIEELFRRYPNAQKYRSVDPGLDHPTACAWAALLPTNQWVFYRILSERGMDIPTRCRRIVELSNNKLSIKRYGPGPKDYYLIETHPNKDSEVPVLTVADFHTFKKDETTGLQYASNYIAAGLGIIESVHTGPEERVLQVDAALKVSNYEPNIRNSPSVPGAPRVFFLRNGPGVLEAFNKWTELYWERITQGPNKGEAKDKIPDHGDDELDAISYLICSPYRWTNYKPRVILQGDGEPESHLVSLSTTIHDKQQQLQAAQQVGFFGTGFPIEEDDDDEKMFQRD